MTEVKKAGADLPVGFCTKCKSNHCTNPLMHRGSWKLIDPKNLPEARQLAKSSPGEPKDSHGHPSPGPTSEKQKR